MYSKILTNLITFKVYFFNIDSIKQHHSLLLNSKLYLPNSVRDGLIRRRRRRRRIM